VAVAVGSGVSVSVGKGVGEVVFVAVGSGDGVSVGAGVSVGTAVGVGVLVLVGTTVSVAVGAASVTAWDTAVGVVSFFAQAVNNKMALHRIRHLFIVIFIASSIWYLIKVLFGRVEIPPVCTKWLETRYLCTKLRS